MLQIFAQYLIGTLIVLWFLLMLSNKVLRRMIVFVAKAISIEVYFERWYLPKEKEIYYKEIYIKTDQLSHCFVDMAFDPHERRRSPYVEWPLPITEDEKMYRFAQECGAAVEKLIKRHPEIILRSDPMSSPHYDVEKWMFEFWIKSDWPL